MPGLPSSKLPPLAQRLAGALPPLLVIVIAGAGLAVDPQRRPAPPASPVERHDPDPLTCQPEAMLAAWSRQLEPFRDQPAAVQERLREVQREMGILSLNRCIQRGLLSRDQARALAIRMGLEPAADRAGQSPSQRP
ncbi:MAG: hypothetical protein ACKO5M_05535 [Vulcanococcus sp.]